jgi:hypothetical protein
MLDKEWSTNDNIVQVHIHNIKVVLRHNWADGDIRTNAVQDLSVAVATTQLQAELLIKDERLQASNLAEVRQNAISVRARIKKGKHLETPNSYVSTESLSSRLRTIRLRALAPDVRVVHHRREGSLRFTSHQAGGMSTKPHRMTMSVWLVVIVRIVADSVHFLRKVCIVVVIPLLAAACGRQISFLTLNFVNPESRDQH